MIENTQPHRPNPKPTIKYRRSRRYNKTEADENLNSSCQTTYYRFIHRHKQPLYELDFNKSHKFSSSLQKFQQQLLQLKSRQKGRDPKLNKREKKRIVQEVHKTTNTLYSQIRAPTKSRLVCPDRMMAQFNRELKKVKRSNSIPKSNEEQNQARKNNLEAFSASGSASQDIENQHSLCYSEGVYVLCGGHGSNGREIASFVANFIHKKCEIRRAECKVDKCILYEIFKSAELELESSCMDVAFSGCTCLALLFQGNQLYIGNIGNSKAILKSRYRVIDLYQEHLPNHPEELSRIQETGGVVLNLEEADDKSCGVPQIWAKGKNPWGPGLPTSRCFGDKAARRYGVTCEPQTFCLPLERDHDFIVMGSASLFNALSKQMVCRALKKNGEDGPTSRQEACDSLISQARAEMEQSENDISNITIYL